MLNSKKKSKKPLALPKHYHVKRGDTVMVISGKDKGQTGVITRVFRTKGKVLVSGVNMITKAVRPNPAAGQEGGLVKMEAPLSVSKVMLYDTVNNQASRARVERTAEGKLVRISKKSGHSFDS